MIKINKILIIFLILLLLNSVLIIKSYALSDIIKDAQQFLKEGESEESPISDKNIKEVNSKIYNILFGIGVGVAVIVGGIIGVSFILSSASGKAKIAEALIPYIVGCVVVFGAFTIWKISINIGNDITDGVELTRDEEMAAVRENASQAAEEAEDAEKVKKWTDDKLKQQYGAHGIDSDLNTKVNGDARGGKNQEKLTLNKAVKTLSKYKQNIYNECKTRGLLADDGIGLK